MGINGHFFTARKIFNSGGTYVSLFHYHDTGMIIITKEWIVELIYKEEITNTRQICRYISFCCSHISMRRSPTLSLNIKKFCESIMVNQKT